MKVAFRSDSSIQIGTGHVMRCLALADALAAKGAKCTFISREHPGNLIDHIISNGHSVYRLPMDHSADSDLSHSAWLGSTQARDAQSCASVLKTLHPAWLVVDHYALDARWESALTDHYAHLMVIDDLADRSHICRLLLDQTFGRIDSDYHSLVPQDCTLLCGSSYALLRPEFVSLRPYSLQRRVQPKIKNLLISMGGVDKDNVTTQVLNALRNCALPTDCEITVVMGASAPWLGDVQQQAKTMRWSTTVRAGINNMAQLMADSDLAIGAAGGMSWERCCLGLPTIMIVLAENQTAVATGLAKIGAARVVEFNEEFMHQLAISITEVGSSASQLLHMSQAASAVVNGKGLDKVLSRLGA